MYGLCFNCARAGEFEDDKCDCCHKKLSISAKTKDEFNDELMNKFLDITTGWTLLEMKGHRTWMRRLLWLSKERKVKIREDGLGFDWLDDGEP